MIQIPTVLVLGAGASAHLGYPTGPVLRDQIIMGLRSTTDPLFTALLQKHGLWQEQIEDFRERLFLSGRTSVDAFLEDSTDFLKIGKLAMAEVLVPCEKMDKLFERSAGNWYYQLFGQMLSGSSYGDFGSNKLAIITFNYDRSLEHFLFTALVNNFGKSQDECREKLRSIPVIHVHGKLSDLDWENSAGRAYSADATSEQVSQSAESIKIIHEVAPDTVEFMTAKQCLREGIRILFLGFGYAEENLRRLGINFDTGKSYAGTAFYLRDAEQEKVRELCRGSINLGHPIWDVDTFLRERVHLSAEK